MPTNTVSSPEDPTRTASPPSTLNINDPSILSALGFLGPITYEHRFGLAVKNWPADVLAHPLTRNLRKGDTMIFLAKNTSRPGRAALIQDWQGLRIAMNPPEASMVLAEAVGVDFTSEEWQ